MQNSPNSKLLVWNKAMWYGCCWSAQVFYRFRPMIPTAFWEPVLTFMEAPEKRADFRNFLNQKTYVNFFSHFFPEKPLKLAGKLSHMVLYEGFGVFGTLSALELGPNFHFSGGFHFRRHVGPLEDHCLSTKISRLPYTTPDLHKSCVIDDMVVGMCTCSQYFRGVL